MRTMVVDISTVVCQGDIYPLLIYPMCFVKVIKQPFGKCKQTLVVDISTVALMLLAKRMSRVDTFQLWWKLSIFIWPVSGFEFEYVDGAPLLGPSNANLYTIQMYWLGRVGARKYTSYPFSHPATNHYKSWHIFVRTNHYKSWNIFVRQKSFG